jgi:ligand-binding sensor domain-containing protein
VLRKKVPDQSNNVIVFNERNASGNQVKILNGNGGSGNIPGSNIFSIAEDKEGEVWLGTDEGIAVFYNPSDLFTNSPSDAERILVNFDGYVQYLLETETVTAIAVDGANRKWMGTDRAGVFLLSADGTEQIYHFTEDNSPLFSNQITSIAINPLTGEVYIGTAKGLIAYKGSATEGVTEMNDIYAFPNPVPSNYSGTIGIRGLVSNANVKITDIGGTLIYETTAAGGQATWDGKNFSGRKAKSGVYLVFVTNEDGSNTMVTKIMIIE